MLKKYKLIILSGALLLATNTAFSLVGGTEITKDATLGTDHDLAVSIESSVNIIKVRAKNISNVERVVFGADITYDNIRVPVDYLIVNNGCIQQDLKSGATCEISFTPIAYSKSIFPATHESTKVTIVFSTTSPGQSATKAKQSDTLYFDLSYDYYLYAHTTDGKAYRYESDNTWQEINMTRPARDKLDSDSILSTSKTYSGDMSMHSIIDGYTNYFNGSQYCTSRGSEYPNMYATDYVPFSHSTIYGGCFWSLGKRNINIEPKPVFNLTYGFIGDLIHTGIHNIGVNADVRALDHTIDGKIEAVGGDFTAACTTNDVNGCLEHSGDDRGEYNHVAYFIFNDMDIPNHSRLYTLGNGLQSSPVDDLQFVMEVGAVEVHPTPPPPPPPKLYITNSMNNTVSMCDSTLTSCTTSNGAGTIARATGIDYGGGKVYVASQGNNISICNSTLTTCTISNGAGTFYTPYAIRLNGGKAYSQTTMLMYQYVIPH